MNKAKLIIAIIMEELSSRKGFDSWYETIDTDIKQEILNDLTIKAKAVLNEDITEMPIFDCFYMLEEEKSSD